MPIPIYHHLHRHYHERYHGVYRHAKKLFFFDLFLLMLAVVMFASGMVFFFWQPSIARDIDLTISLGDQRIVSGAPIEAHITVVNRAKYTLRDAILSVRLPVGFVIDRDRTPTETLSDQSTADIGVIAPGGQVEKTIYGYLWGTVGSSEKITAGLTFVPEGKSRRDQKMSVMLAAISDSVIGTELSVPTRGWPGQSIVGSMTVTNHSDRSINNLEILDQKNLTLGAGEAKNFALNFTAPGRSGTATFPLRVAVTINGALFDQNKNNATVEIGALPDMSLSARWDAPSYIEGGLTIPVEIGWKNIDTREFTNGSLAIRFTPAGVVDTRATALLNHWQMSGDEIIADKNIRTALGAIRNGDSDRLTIEVVTRPNFDINNGEKVNLEITPIMTVEATDLPGVTAKISGNPARAPIATEMNLTAQARYYTADGDQLGRGPLPPVVEQTTKYWVFVRARNTTNAARDARFTANLPDGVTMTGKQSVTIGSPITYDSRTRALTWNYPLLPANSTAGMYFEVAVTPMPADLGATYTLLKNLRFSAVDDWTGKSFALTAPDVKNILPADDEGAGMGYQVIAAE